ncbi:MAG: hypothetical protein M1833_005095 [Piccolia ochrophora]|nr:MAG: hypothetical protein M1833_005095 [Piccolia ochrophora]
MKSYYLASILSLSGSLIAPASAWPTSLEIRSKGNIALSVFSFIKNQIGDANAYDFKKLKDFCAVQMKTYAGGNCYASIECSDGGKVEYKDWNVCYVGGRQHFHDDRIGEFSITFSQAGGQKGNEEDGLHTPILQVAYIDNWAEMDVEKFVTESDKDDSGKVCTEISYETAAYQDGKNKEWFCGVPKAGKGGKVGDTTFDSNIPHGAGGYAPGPCGMHILQYQKPDPSKDPYSLEVSLKDANGDEVGRLDKTEMRAPQVIKGKLPVEVTVNTGAEDKDPISITYGGDVWTTADTPDGKARCGVGPFDNGRREIDCGFTCA